MQINIEQINLDAGRSFRAYEYSFPNREQLFHFHSEYELAVVTGTGGIVYCGAETTVFQSGDLFLFGGRLPHRFIAHPHEPSLDASGGAAAGPKSLARVVQFRIDAFGSNFFNLPENSLIRKVLNSSNRGLALRSGHPASSSLGDRMEVINTSGVNRRLPELLLLLADLADLEASGQLEVLSPGAPNLRTQDGDARRLSRLQDYIETGYARGVSVDMAAGKLALTRTSFCRYVKRMTGRTFTELVNDYRLTMAAMRLREGQATISSISEDVGFGSLSHFNSRFRERFGMTPTEYRGVGQQM